MQEVALIRALEVAKRDHATDATMTSEQNNRMFTRYINASGPTAYPISASFKDHSNPLSTTYTSCSKCPLLIQSVKVMCEVGEDPIMTMSVK